VIDPWFGYRGEDVVQTLERICSTVGCPLYDQIRYDDRSQKLAQGRQMTCVFPVGDEVPEAALEFTFTSTTGTHCRRWVRGAWAMSAGVLWGNSVMAA
jgi:hypothetical protein